MYLLITFVHLLFIIAAQLLGYYILEGIFVFLFAFFLLYFSPIFFTKEKVSIPKISFEKLSLKNSITIPLLFVYGALYLFLFWLLGDAKLTFEIGVYTLTLGFLIFFGYMMIADWKNDIFFDVTRIHLTLSYTVWLLFLVISFFIHTPIRLENIFLLITSLIFSFFFFRVSKEESPLLFQICLITILSSIYSIWNYFTQDTSLGIFLSIIIISSVVLFESMPKIPFFSQFLIESRITTLSLILWLSVTLMTISIWDFTFFPTIIIALIFLLSVHIRYSNYIAFFIWVGAIFFLYSTTFFSLISENSLFSSLLFVFFLPLCIISSTYFWEEKFSYDFSLLHYTSIAFSSIFSLYILLFVGWGSAFFFVTSGCIFLTGILLILSYFRFKYK